MKTVLIWNHIIILISEFVWTDYSVQNQVSVLTVKQWNRLEVHEAGSWVITLLFSNCCAFAACHHHLQVCSNSWCAVSATHCMPDAGEAPEANHISGCSLFFLQIQSHCYHRMCAAKIWGSNQSPYKRAQGMLHLASDSISPPTAIQHFLLEQPDELKLHTFLYLRSAQGGKNN